MANIHYGRHPPLVATTVALAHWNAPALRACSTAANKAHAGLDPPGQIINLAQNACVVGLVLVRPHGLRAIGPLPAPPTGGDIAHHGARTVPETILLLLQVAPHDDLVVFGVV